MLDGRCPFTFRNSSTLYLKEIRGLNFQEWTENSQVVTGIFHVENSALSTITAMGIWLSSKWFDSEKLLAQPHQPHACGHMRQGWSARKKYGFCFETNKPCLLPFLLRPWYFRLMTNNLHVVLARAGGPSTTSKRWNALIEANSWYINKWCLFFTQLFSSFVSVSVLFFRHQCC